METWGAVRLLWSHCVGSACCWSCWSCLNVLLPGRACACLGNWQLRRPASHTWTHVIGGLGGGCQRGHVCNAVWAQELQMLQLQRGSVALCCSMHLAS